MNITEIAIKIMGVEIGDNPMTDDNLAVIICTHFQSHPDNPHDGEMDEFDCWEKWVVDQYMKYETAISNLIAEEIKKVEFSPLAIAAKEYSQ
jgi:hypothetical protein